MRKQGFLNKKITSNHTLKRILGDSSPVTSDPRSRYCHFRKCCKNSTKVLAPAPQRQQDCLSNRKDGSLTSHPDSGELEVTDSLESGGPGPIKQLKPELRDPVSQTLPQ